MVNNDGGLARAGMDAKPDARRERIVEIVHQRERVSVDQLAALLGSSRETVRRDLSLLSDARRIRKYHGGAMMPDAMKEGPLAHRLQVAVSQKTAIARAAAALFDAGDTIFVDMGTTTLSFAHALVERPGLTVITNGPEIARVAAEGGAKVFVIGGEYRSDFGEMAGPLAVEQIERFHAAHAVITIGALAENGPMNFQLEEAQIARAMIAQARSVTVLADRSKLGKAALFQVCPLATLDRLVIDHAPDAAMMAALDAAEVEVIVADNGRV